MFVGETGVGRTIERTCAAMKAAGIEDPHAIDRIRSLGVIDLPTILKKLNLHYTLSLDLFGQEVSTNAANAFNAGIKGRYMESRLEDDHKLINDTYRVWNIENGQLVQKSVPALTSINMRLRDDYTRDAAGGVGRWNKIIEKAGSSSRCGCRTRRSTGRSASSPISRSIRKARCSAARRMKRGGRIGCRRAPMAISSNR